MTKANTQSQNTQWIQGTIGRETRYTLAGRQEAIQRDRKHLGRETGDNRVERQETPWQREKKQPGGTEVGKETGDTLAVSHGTPLAGKEQKLGGAETRDTLVKRQETPWQGDGDSCVERQEIP